MSSRASANCGVIVEITVHAGRDLVAKDRARLGLGKRTTSDPYVCVLQSPEPPHRQHNNGHSHNLISSIGRCVINNTVETATYSNSSNNAYYYRSNYNNWDNKIRTGVSNIMMGAAANAGAQRLQTLGNASAIQPCTRITPTQHKTTSPVWSNSQPFKLYLNQTQARQLLFEKSITLVIYDEDLVSSPDCMGIVRIPIVDSMVRENGNKSAPQWYPVETGNSSTSEYYCRNATGQLQVSITLTAYEPLQLVRGNYHSIRYDQVHVGLSWDVEGRGGGSVDLDVSCVCIDHHGQVLLQESVYYGNLSNSNMSVYHSGDSRTGHGGGAHDELVTCHMNQIPRNVLAMYLVLSVVSPNRTLADIRSASVSLYSVHNQQNASSGAQCFCVFQPSALGTNTSLFLARFARDTSSSDRWIFAPIEQGDGCARDFGTLMPQLKALSRDVLPNIVIDPTERVAIMRKNDVVSPVDYLPGHHVPQWVTLGLKWDVTNGVQIDLDAAVICLDEALNCVEIIYFGNKRSNNGSIVHGGDEREGDVIGDDERINLSLSSVDPRVKYLGFVINSYSGQELDDVARASCHLFETASKRDIATYTLTANRQLDKRTALIMACLYRSENRACGGEEGEWLLRIISEPAQGKTAQDNVDELQNYLRCTQPAPPSYISEHEPDIDLSMPAQVSHDDEEIHVVPFSTLEDKEIAL
jgi:stress response protein SCP2